MINEINLNLPPTLPGYTRCECCQAEIPQNVYNRRFCTMRCRKRLENARRKARDKSMEVEATATDAIKNDPKLAAKHNLNHEQLNALCAYVKTNPAEIMELPGNPPSDWTPPTGFSATRGNGVKWLLLYDPAADEGVAPIALTEAQQMQEATNARIAKLLQG